MKKISFKLVFDGILQLLFVVMPPVALLFAWFGASKFKVKMFETVFILNAYYWGVMLINNFGLTVEMKLRRLLKIQANLEKMKRERK
jgi:hypothetical protein